MAADEIRFDGQVVLVSGAGRGIGRGYALLLAERGAHVVVNDVDRDVAKLVVDEIAAAGGAATAAAGDVVDDAAAVVGTALGVDGGRLDALVNNAGIANVRPFGADGATEMERLLHVHTVGTAELTVAAWDVLIASKGRVVNTTSGSVIGLMHHTAYAAAKGAILGFTRALALESEALGVRVNAVMPMARTRMFEQAGGEAGSDQDEMMTKYFGPEHIAPTVVFLASDSVPYNGQIIEASAGTAAFVHFATTPYVPARTPEEARDSLAASPGDLTAVGSLIDMMMTKFTMLAEES